MALKRVTPGLKTKTLTTGKQRLYTDLDLSFAAKPGSEDADGVFKGDVYKKSDIDAVIQSVQNILLTNKGEKPFEPTFGANLREMLFDQTSLYSEAFVSELIKLSVSRWEPRASVLNVNYYTGQRLIESGFSDFRSQVSNTVRIDVELLINNEGRVASVNMNRLR